MSTLKRNHESIADSYVNVGVLLKMENIG